MTLKKFGAASSAQEIPINNQYKPIINIKQYQSTKINLNSRSLCVPTIADLGGVLALDLKAVASLKIFSSLQRRCSSYFMFIKPTLEFMMNSHLVALQKSILSSWVALKVWLVMVQAFKDKYNDGASLQRK